VKRLTPGLPDLSQIGLLKFFICDNFFDFAMGDTFGLPAILNFGCWPSDHLAKHSRTNKMLKTCERPGFIAALRGATGLPDRYQMFGKSNHGNISIPGPANMNDEIWTKIQYLNFVGTKRMEDAER
jgi:hypothetical protein